MNRIDETIPFIPVSIAVLTVSDTRNEKTDKSGALLASMIEQAGHHVAERAIVIDDAKAIRKQVKTWIKDPEIDVVITTGGTGFAERDVTPEAVKPLFDKEIDGFSALFHMLSYQERRHLDGAVESLRRHGGTAPHLLPAGVAWGLQGWLERHPQIAARQPSSALQLHRGHAALQGHARRTKSKP